MKWEDDITFWGKATLNSYTQVFFSKNTILGALLVLITFLDPVLGLSGLLTVLISNLLALWMGFQRQYISEGSYGFNSLLVGLGLGAYYQANLPFFILLIIASLITFMLTVAVSGVLGKYGLPYLSIPFLLGLWSVMLASRHFQSLGISERGVYVLNELYEKGSHWLVNLYHRFNALPIHELIKIYFKSLGAILFQFNIISGIVIATGLLISSRIAFTLSLLSFFTAYFFYNYIGADISELNYSYIGFNFILTGIAIGAFFLIPSWHSYLWSILLIPPLVILTSSLGNLFEVPQLGIYSLPFNLVVITFLYVLKLRFRAKGPEETTVQLYQPEKNLYEKLSNEKRYRNYTKTGIGLPVFGEWLVSQGPDGDITHKEEWADAWDFIIVDEDGKQFKNQGTSVEDYYCFGKPVVAPAKGVVEALVNDVEDNTVGDSNLMQNWGNTIVIRHDDQLFSQISHLKKGSIKVKKRDEVTRGQVLAACGNSGRSPEPHVHFQLQATPFIGSKTLKYPLNHFLVKRGERPAFKFFDYPEEGEIVRDIPGNDLMKNAFNFIPGKRLEFTLTDEENEPNPISWEVRTDVYNNAYLHCPDTRSKAYFVNDGTVFYFTFFEGNKSSILYHFYLAAYKVLLTYDKGLQVEDHYPLYNLASQVALFFHDFTAPFFQYIKANYRLHYQADGDLGMEEIALVSHAELTSFGRVVAKADYKLLVRDDKICEFEIETKQQKAKARCIEC